MVGYMIQDNKQHRLSFEELCQYPKSQVVFDGPSSNSSCKIIDKLISSVVFMFNQQWKIEQINGRHLMHAFSNNGSLSFSGHPAWC